MPGQRYFLKLSYKGTNFCGWQRQSNGYAIQEEIEDGIALLLRKKVNVIGCGRTDSGVHAKNYIAHIHLDEPLEIDLKFKLNHVLSKDIVIHDIWEVHEKAHARFDAFERRYCYRIKSVKDPFQHEYYYYYPMLPKLDFALLQEAAQTLKEYTDFFTFCKNKTDVKTTICYLTKCEWIKISDDEIHFEIASNRFLRGMVRLIVGMCINVSLGKLSIEQVRFALDNKKRMERDWSVFAQGLALEEIKYPDNVKPNFSLKA